MKLTTQLPPGIKLASLSRRAVATILDSIPLGAASIAVALHWGVPGEYEASALPELALLAGIAAYWVFAEGLFGTTFGKLMLDLRVVSVGGERCTLSQSFKRNLLRPVDGFFGYLVGFIVANSVPLRQRLGDLWAGTIVIHQRDRNA